MEGPGRCDLTSAPRRVVVTGGAGFIGLHTVRRLEAEGFRILVIDDLRHGCGEPLPADVDLERMDIASADAAAAIVRFRPDGVLHLAAQGGVRRSIKDPTGDATINVVGTVAMLKAGIDAGCPRFVFASSGGAIYGQADKLPANEAAPARPLSPYGAAKMASEGYLGMFSRTFGLRTLALRYSNVYGPFQDGTGEAGVVAITCERLLSPPAGLPPRIRGDGRQTRDFVHVSDVADANLRALNGEAEGALNIGTGIAATVRMVVDLLVEGADYAGPIDLVEARPGEVRDVALDAQQAGRVLGWHPQVQLPDGLRQTLMSFRERAARRGRAIGAPAEA